VPAVLIQLIADAYPVDASSWSLRDLLRLRGMGEPHALQKIATEPWCAQQNATSGDYPFHLAVYFQASQPVLDALLQAAPGAANVKFM
jgi:hypothetical protein